MRFNPKNTSNTPEANKNIFSPANDSLRQSYRIAALERFYGMRGLASPVYDREHDIRYDFMHVESSTLIKFFTSLDREELERYEALSREGTLFIVEIENAEPFQCSNCHRLHTGQMPDELLTAIDILDPLLYWDHKLWFDEDDDGTWNIVMPYERFKIIDELGHIDYE